MDIIKRILGEAETEEEEPKKKKKSKSEPDKPDKPDKPDQTADSNSHDDADAPDQESSDIEELARLWTQGSRDDVAQRFMGMDNETAVRVVFAIGKEGSLELARMVDDMLERMGDQEGVEMPGGEGEPFELGQGGPGEGQASTEPASFEPGSQGDPVNLDYPEQIMGNRS